MSDPVELARKYVTLSGEIEDVRRGQGCENPDAHACTPQSRASAAPVQLRYVMSSCVITVADYCMKKEDNNVGDGG